MHLLLGIARRMVLLATFCCCVLVNHSTAQSSADTNQILKNFKLVKQLYGSNINAAQQLNTATLAQSRKLNYQQGMLRGLVNEGIIFLFNAKTDSAIAIFRKVLKQHKEHLNYEMEAEIHLKMNSAYRIKGEKDSAFYSIFKALRLYENAHDSVNIAGVYNRLGESNFSYSKNKEALDYLLKAKSILQRHIDSNLLAATYTNFGIVYYFSDGYQDALTSFLKALELHKRLKNERLTASDYNYLGLCYEVLNKDALAKTSYKKALDYFTKTQLKDEKIEVLFNIGVFFFNRNQPDSALNYFEKIVGLLKETNNMDLQLKNLSLLSETYAMKGNFAKAYEYQTAYTALNDSLLNTEKVKSIADMQTKYETEKKEQQIVLLDQQNKTRAAQRNFFIAGSIVLLLVIVVLGIYFIQRSRIAKKNNELAQQRIGNLLQEQEIKSYNAMLEGQEEERKRIATELHDRLGSMLSTVKLLFNSLSDKMETSVPMISERKDKVSNLLDEAVLEVRRVSHNLSTGTVNSFGLVAALEDLSESVDKTGLIRCKFLCYGMHERLNQGLEIGVFRMVQELVNNALKHSKAKQLTIQLNRHENAVTVTVEDDGIGFDVQEKRRKGGIGLKNLEIRAEKMDGSYQVDSRPGQGTISIIEIPLPQSD